MPRAFFAFFFASIFFFSCSPNNVTIDNSLQRYFDSAGVQGSFGFFDNGQGHFTIYNLSRFRDSLYQPGASFDILQSLIGIQTGVVKDDSSLLLSTPVTPNQASATTLSQNTPMTLSQSPAGSPGQTTPETVGQCFRDTSLAGRSGFIQLSSRLGKDTLKKWIDSLRYGNQQIGRDTTGFWFDNSLKINADEQLGLLKKLYFDQLPFYPRPQLIVRRMMSGESNSNYQLRYKLAQGTKEDGHAIGWVMGWVEENKHPYFFVVNLESADPQKDLGAAGLSIARGILQQLGFFQGKK
jgi:beta-lactamase class D